MTWNGINRAHLVGVCGAGMKGLAEFLSDCGVKITASDENPNAHVLNALTELGIEFFNTHSADNLDDRTELLIHSPAILADNIERQRANELNIEQWSYPVALSHAINGLDSFAISGTHGKSSVTAMLGHLLVQSQRDPVIFCGAEAINTGRNGRAGTGQYAVVEACEYRRHFQLLKPQNICLLGIDADHFDCYPSIDDAVSAYSAFVHNLPGVLFYNADCERSIRIAHIVSQNESFALDSSISDWTTKNRCRSNGITHFDVLHHSEKWGSFEIHQPGEHTVLNTLAVIAMAASAGLSATEIQVALSDYLGLRRRFEMIHYSEKQIIVDDYAHHPAEIKAVISSIREDYADRELICVFQPHQVSRTMGLFQEFAMALQQADQILILPVFGAREPTTYDFAGVSQQLAQKVANLGTTCHYVETLDQVWGVLETVATEPCVIATLGAGSISQLHMNG